MKQTNLQRIGALALITIASFFAPDDQAIAQEKDYTPGEKIEYLASTHPHQVGETGVFVKMSDAGSYAIVRLNPSEAYKEGRVEFGQNQRVG